MILYDSVTGVYKFLHFPSVPVNQVFKHNLGASKLYQQGLNSCVSSKNPKTLSKIGKASIAKVSISKG